MKQKEYFEKILITEEQINEKCKELGEWVNKTYAESNDLILIGLLKGSIPFLAQLIKNVEVNHKLDFMTVTSFGGGMKSTGNAKIIMDLKSDIYDKDVLIVEDIVDSGITLKNVINTLNGRNPKSLRVLTLLDKKEGRTVKMEVDKFGFEVPNKFLAGFGLDVKDFLRNVPYIGIFDKSKLDKLK